MNDGCFITGDAGTRDQAAWHIEPVCPSYTTGAWFGYSWVKTCTVTYDMDISLIGTTV